jgi:hypothetical protein
LLPLPFPRDQKLILPKTKIIINIKLLRKEIVEEIKENNYANDSVD